MQQYYIKRPGLGSIIELVIYTDYSKTKVENFNKKFWKMVYSFERQFSRFIPDSELSRFNRNAGLKFYPSREFMDILKKAKYYSILSKGLYNPFILPAVQKVGYLHSKVKGFENDAVDDYRNRSVLTIDKLEIEDDWVRIPYGGAIDLGGIGKGYLADKIAKMLSKEFEGFWVSLGGDMVVKAQSEEIKIAIANGVDQAKTIGFFHPKLNSVDNIASSGPNQRKGRKLLKTWHHLIDPRTLKPAKTNVQLVSISSASCTNSDILASIMVIDMKIGLALIDDFKVNSLVIQYIDKDSLKYKYLGENLEFSKLIKKFNIIKIENEKTK